jgi:hypothetical protein
MTMTSGFARGTIPLCSPALTRGRYSSVQSISSVLRYRKLHRGNILVDSLRGEFAFVEQVQLLLADGLEVQLFGAPAEILSEPGDVMDIVALGFRREIA